MEIDVEMTGLQFKKLITLGRVTTIDGAVTYCSSSTDGGAAGLYIGRKGTIRPPIDTIKDDDELLITDIQIVTDTIADDDEDGVELVVFNLHEVAAMVKIL